MEGSEGAGAPLDQSTLFVRQWECQDWYLSANNQNCMLECGTGHVT